MIIKDLNQLRKKNNQATLDEASEILRLLEKELAESEALGIGLAANQVGIHKKVAIVRIKHENEEENIDLINPVIIEKYNSFINIGEGCLSIPGKRVNTYRYKEIFVKDDLHPAGFIATDLVAVAIQHEIDHLDGLLIVDRVAGKNKIGRNDPCPCGRIENGKPIKWKKCHGR